MAATRAHRYRFSSSWGMNELANRIVDEIRDFVDYHSLLEIAFAEGLYKHADEGCMLLWYCAVSAACYMARNIRMRKGLNRLLQLARGFPDSWPISSELRRNTKI